MKKFRFFQTLFLLLLVSHPIHAEDPDTLSLLQSRVWRHRFEPQNIELFYRYGERKMQGTLIFEKDTVVLDKPYYLSDTMDKAFDFSKPGTVHNGRFIVHYNQQQRTVEFSEILELGPDSLRTISRFLPNPDGSPVIRIGRPIPVTYTRIIE